MNTNDLYLEYARVIKMCEGTELEDTPWRIIQWRNIPNGVSKWECFTTHPDFGMLDPHTEVRFSVAVLWTPPTPKRTFTLNSVELPCPVKGDGHALSIDNIIFCFNNIEDAELVSKSLINLLTEARDKP